MVLPVLTGVIGGRDVVEQLAEIMTTEIVSRKRLKSNDLQRPVGRVTDMCVELVPILFFLPVSVFIGIVAIGPVDH